MKTRGRAALLAALLREEARFVLLLIGAGVLITAMHVLTTPSATRWAGRTAEQWRPVLRSPLAESRDSALVAIGTLEPVAARTIRAAAEMLSDSDENVAQSALEILVDAGRDGGAILPMVVDGMTMALRSTNPRHRERAVSILGAIGTATPRVVLLVISAMPDTCATVRAAAASALGSVLEGRGQQTDSMILAQAVARLSLATNDSAPLVRDAAIEALFRTIPHDPRVPPLLESALGDSSADVRDRAAWILRALQPRGARDGQAAKP